jgi:integrase/recombinase XerD
MIHDLARFHRKDPTELGPEPIRAWLLHLLQERKLSASSFHLAVNALASFYHAHLGRDLEPILQGIRRPKRHPQPPRVYSPSEIESLLTTGTQGSPLARAFLMTVYGCGLRLSEATHVQVQDIDSARHQLRVSHPKGGRMRVVPLSDNLLVELRSWYRVHRRAVFAKGSVAGPEAILQYLGQYTHRVAIANARIRRVDEQGVSFTYKDYRDRDRIKEMHLGGVEFVRRLSHQVLP